MKKSEVSTTYKENDPLFISSRLVLHLQFISRREQSFPGLCWDLQQVRSRILGEQLAFSL